MMGDVAVWRLNVLRSGYLLLVVGLGAVIWPSILDGEAWGLSRGIVVCMLGAMSLLAVLGVVRPLRMLPVLLFEIGWKALWLGRVALPAWRAGRVDAGIAQTAPECAMVVVIVVVVPWAYVWRTYLAGKGEPWRGLPRCGDVH